MTAGPGRLEIFWVLNSKRSTWRDNAGLIVAAAPVFDAR